jgi:hypothetical protein
MEASNNKNGATNQAQYNNHAALERLVVVS